MIATATKATGFRFGDRLRATLLPRPIPSMLEWATENVIVPDGPYRGQPFDPDTQPFARLLLQEMENPRWNRFVIVGPSQSGKTLLGFAIPTLWHLFARGETVCCGLPDANMLADKWTQGLLPVIEASPRLRPMLPRQGGGARGGQVKSAVRFRNGATLKFLTAGGRDASRAGFSVRVLVVTEADALGRARKTSDEADPLRQMEARTRAYLKAGARVYLESTCSTSTGRIWTEYQGGSQARIARPCPRCGVFVTPEREHLAGWQDAETELQARAAAIWTCPACSQPWTETERQAANLRGVLVHSGQEVTAGGEVVGDAPQTRTLGFRWSAVDNLFVGPDDIGGHEWGAAKGADADSVEKELRQYVFAIPWDPPDVEFMPLQPGDVAKRVTGTKRGTVPQDTITTTVGIDTGKRELHWAAVAWNASGGGVILDYGVQAVDVDKLGIQRGLVEALQRLRSYLTAGWRTETGGTVAPSQVWIDAGWSEHVDGVFTACRGANAGCRIGAEIWRPSRGFGTGQRRMGSYHIPRRTGNEVRHIGRGFHLVTDATWRMFTAQVDSDTWKTILHERLQLPIDNLQALKLFAASDPKEHDEFTRQLTAERQVTRYVEGRGESVVWERIRRQNHFLDAAYLAAAAGELALTLQTRPAPRRRTLTEMARASNR